jgi:hypothetical protein
VYTVGTHSPTNSNLGNYYYCIVTDSGFDLGSAAPPDSHLLASDVDPDFNEPIKNITVPVGREAVLSCLVTELGQYKVSSMIYSHMPSLSRLVSCGNFLSAKFLHSYATYGYVSVIVLELLLEYVSSLRRKSRLMGPPCYVCVCVDACICFCHVDCDTV